MVKKKVAAWTKNESQILSLRHLGNLTLNFWGLKFYKLNTTWIHLERIDRSPAMDSPQCTREVSTNSSHWNQLLVQRKLCSRGLYVKTSGGCNKVREEFLKKNWRLESKPPEWSDFLMFFGHDLSLVTVLWDTKNWIHCWSTTCK